MPQYERSTVMTQLDSFPRRQIQQSPQDLATLFTLGPILLNLTLVNESTDVAAGN